MYGNDPTLQRPHCPCDGGSRFSRPTTWFWTAHSIVPSSFGQTDRGRPDDMTFQHRDVITIPFLSMRLVAGGVKYPIARMIKMCVKLQR